MAPPLLVCRPSAIVAANTAQEKDQAAHQRRRLASPLQDPAELIVGQTYWLRYHQPGQTGHGKLYGATYQGADGGVGSWAWLDQAESEKVFAQLLVLHLLSVEELQAAREAPETCELG